jgi:hypothetical protein
MRKDKGKPKMLAQMRREPWRRLNLPEKGRPRRPDLDFWGIFWYTLLIESAWEANGMAFPLLLFASYSFVFHSDYYVLLRKRGAVLLVCCVTRASFLASV